MIIRKFSHCQELAAGTHYSYPCPSLFQRLGIFQEFYPDFEQTDFSIDSTLLFLGLGNPISLQKDANCVPELGKWFLSVLN